MTRFSHRPDSSHGRIAHGARHLVSAGHHAAAAAGFLILEAGGNAVDAGVAAGLALAVVQSDIVSFAGVAPLMIRSGETGEVISIDGLGGWPQQASAEFFRSNFGGIIPAGVLRTVIPGAPAAWIAALQRFGTMSFTEVVQPAIDLARNGFAVHPTMADYVAQNAGGYLSFAENAALYCPGGKPLAVGDILRQPALADTLDFLASEERTGGKKDRVAALQAVRDAFYLGDIATAVADYHRDNDGWMTRSDFANYQVSIERPISKSWRGGALYVCGPWSQGPVLAQALAVLENFDLSGMGRNSVEYIHVVTEALKLAFWDREKHYGDPNLVDVPMERLLSADYNALQGKRIYTDRTLQNSELNGIVHGSPTESKLSPDTSYVSIVDRWGNAFSATPSDTSADTPIVPAIGLAISSRGAQSFTAKGHPSEIAPGKRPRLTPNPAIYVFNDGRVMPFGSPGGDVQVQAMLQMLLNITVFENDLAEAIEAPRFATYAFPGSFEPHQTLENRLQIEQRIPGETCDALSTLGHVVTPWSDYSFNAGAVCAVIHDPNSGVKIAAADPRRNTGTCGW